MEKYAEHELIRLAQEFCIDIGLAKSLVSKRGDNLDCIERELLNYSLRKVAESTNGKASLKDAVAEISVNKKSTEIKP